MDAFSHCEFGIFFKYLDIGSLLVLPCLSRQLAYADADAEAQLWHRRYHDLVGKSTNESSACVIDDDRAFEVPALPAKTIGCKSACRLHLYLKMHFLPDIAHGLSNAASCDHLAVLKLLLQCGGDPNLSAGGVGYTNIGAIPLHMAAKNGHLAAMGTLVNASANINVIDQNGRTPLMVASSSGQAESVRWMVGRGACVDVETDYGYTALHYAALLARLEIMDLLLAAGAPACVQDKEERSPLHLVLQGLPRNVPIDEFVLDPSGFGDEYCYNRQNISQGYTVAGAHQAQQDEIVKRAVVSLLRHGADLEMRDCRGQTARECLEGKNRPDLLHWFDGIPKSLEIRHDAINLSNCSEIQPQTSEIQKARETFSRNHSNFSQSTLPGWLTCFQCLIWKSQH